GTLAPIVLGPIIDADGWRAGYETLSMIMLASLPIVLGLLAVNGVGKADPKPANKATQPPRLGEIVRQAPFVRLAATFFSTALATGGAVVHFVPMLIDAGYPAPRAAQMASLLGLSLVTGRLLTGIAMDYVFAPRLAVVLMVVSAAGFATLALGGGELLTY